MSVTCASWVSIIIVHGWASASAKKTWSECTSPHKDCDHQIIDINPDMRLKSCMQCFANFILFLIPSYPFWFPSLYTFSPGGLWYLMFFRCATCFNSWYSLLDSEVRLFSRILFMDSSTEQLPLATPHWVRSQILANHHLQSTEVWLQKLMLIGKYLKILIRLFCWCRDWQWLSQWIVPPCVGFHSSENFFYHFHLTFDLGKALWWE